MKFLRFLTFALAASVMLSSCEEAEEAAKDAVDDLIEDLTDDSTTDDSTTDDSTTDDSTTDDSTTDDSTTDDSTTDDSTTDDSTTGSTVSAADAASVAIYDTFMGGVVYYKDDSVIKVISSSNAVYLQWNAEITDYEEIAGNDNTITEGSVLTAAIAAATNYSAAKYPGPAYCIDSTESGYSDWYLPSSTELQLICQYGVDDYDNFIAALPVDENSVGYTTQYHWSSTQVSDKDGANVYCVKVKSDGTATTCDSYSKVNSSGGRYIRCGRNITITE